MAQPWLSHFYFCLFGSALAQPFLFLLIWLSPDSAISIFAYLAQPWLSHFYFCLFGSALIQPDLFLANLAQPWFSHFLSLEYFTQPFVTPFFVAFLIHKYIYEVLFAALDIQINKHKQDPPNTQARSPTHKHLKTPFQRQVKAFSNRL